MNRNEKDYLYAAYQDLVDGNSTQCLEKLQLLLFSRTFTDVDEPLPFDPIPSDFEQITAEGYEWITSGNFAHRLFGED